MYQFAIVALLALAVVKLVDFIDGAIPALSGFRRGATRRGGGTPGRSRGRRRGAADGGGARTGRRLVRDCRRRDIGRSGHRRR